MNKKDLTDRVEVLQDRLNEVKVLIKYYESPFRALSYLKLELNTLMKDMSNE